MGCASAAARKRDEAGAAGRDIEILVVDRNPYHNIRVRNYEVDLSERRASADRNCSIPIGVAHRPRRRRGHRSGAAPHHRWSRRTAAMTSIAYDRLVLALGSEVPRPDIPGLAQHAFDVDTFTAAQRLEAASRVARTAAQPRRAAPRSSWSAPALPASRSRPKCRTSWRSAGITGEPPHRPGRSESGR